MPRRLLQPQLRQESGRDKCLLRSRSLLDCHHRTRCCSCHKAEIGWTGGPAHLQDRDCFPATKGPRGLVAVVPGPDTLQLLRIGFLQIGSFDGSSPHSPPLKILTLIALIEKIFPCDSEIDLRGCVKIAKKNSVSEKAVEKHNHHYHYVM